MNYLVNKLTSTVKIYIFTEDDEMVGKYDRTNALFVVSHHADDTWDLLVAFDSLVLEPRDWTFHHMIKGELPSFILRDVVVAYFRGAPIS